MRARWLFFTLFSVLAMPGRFLPVFYAAHAQTDTQIGLLIATPQFVSLFAGPFFCNLADRTGRRELVAALTYLAAIFCFLSQLIALPELDLLAPSARFPFLMVCRVLFGFFSAPAYPLVSAITISQLRETYGENGHERFGEERLWGAVSWAVCALTLGLALDLPGIDVWIVYVGMLFFGSGFIASLWLFYRNHNSTKQGSICLIESPEYRRLLDAESSEVSGHKEGAENEREWALPVQEAAADRQHVDSNVREESMSATKAFYRILTEGGLSTLMFFNLLLWLFVGMSLVENLLFLFFEDDLHASNFLCGISVVVTVIFEIPLFARAPELLERFGSASLAMLGSLSFVVRGIGYTVAPNGWVALLVEPLHGVTYAAVATASVSFVAERTETELEATGQSLIDVIHAIAFTLGTGIGGYVMQNLGSKFMYRGAAALVLVATVSFGMVEWCLI